VRLDVVVQAVSVSAANRTIKNRFMTLPHTSRRPAKTSAQRKHRRPYLSSWGHSFARWDRKGADCRFCTGFSMLVDDNAHWRSTAILGDSNDYTSRDP
jgi:hypothetical protein